MKKKEKGKWRGREGEKEGREKKRKLATVEKKKKGECSLEKKSS